MSTFPSFAKRSSPFVGHILHSNTVQQFAKKIHKMDETSFKLLAKYLPSTYVQQAKDARNSQNFLINQLLEKVNRKIIFRLKNSINSII